MLKKNNERDVPIEGTRIVGLLRIYTHIELSDSNQF